MGPKKRKVNEGSSRRSARQVPSEPTPLQRQNAGSNPIPPLKFVENQEGKFDILSGLGIVATKYLDLQMLDELGLKDDAKFMFENIGWSKFMKIDYPSYTRITLEFLSSLHTEILSGPNCEGGVIEFRMFNNSHKLNLAEFNTCFGFPINGCKCVVPKGFDEDEMWQSITNTSERFQAAKSKASSIAHPLIKIMQRYLANTVFGRGTSMGHVRACELFFLKTMLDPTFECTSCCRRIDVGAHMARHLQKITGQDSGMIVVGGLITAIAYKVGYRSLLRQITPIPHSPPLNFTACFSMKMLVQKGQSYYFIEPTSGTLFLLPDPTRSVTDKANWKYPETPSTDQEPPTTSSPPTVDNATILAAIHNFQEQQQHYNTMVQQLYDWHLHQYPGEFPHHPPQ